MLKESSIFQAISNEDQLEERIFSGRITEFRYCQKIAWGIQDPNQLQGVYDPGWGMTDPDKAFVFVDNHDNQRGHGGAGMTSIANFTEVVTQ